LTEDLQDFIQNLNGEVVGMTTEATKMEKQLGEHHKLVDRLGVLKNILKQFINVYRNKYNF